MLCLQPRGWENSFDKARNGTKAYLVLNAEALIASHTSRKGTSFVNVYPCSTLGSALRAVEAEIHGVGILDIGSLAGLGGAGDLLLFR